MTREEVVKWLESLKREIGKAENRTLWHYAESIDMAIEALSAEPKTGKWEEVEDYNGDIHYQCDRCGNEFILIDGTPKDNNYHFCPNCGAKIGKGGDDK